MSVEKIGIIGDGTVGSALKELAESAGITVVVEDAANLTTLAGAQLVIEALPERFELKAQALEAAAKVADGFFWIALSAADKDISSNLSLMRDRDWIDLPFVYENGQRAILTFEKGPDGEAAFNQAFAAWGTG